MPTNTHRDTYRQQAIDAFREAGTIRGAARLLRANGHPFPSRQWITSCLDGAGIPRGGEATVDRGGSPVGLDVEDLKTQILGFVESVVAKQSKPVTFKAAEPEPEDPIATERERQDRVRGLRHERELVKDIAGEQSLRAYLTALIRDVVEPIAPPPPLPSLPPSKGASVETMVLCLSDWHAYEVVKRERVQNMNQYDAPTFARRAKRVVSEAVKIKDRMEAGGGWRVPKCVVSLNGDFVSGTIHEVERHSDAPDVIRAVYGCAVTLSLALRDLAPHFDLVECFATSGNHGRLPDARKMQAKDPCRNWDTMIYLIAEAMLRDVPTIKFYIPDSYVCSFDIGSKRFVQYHGHSIKSWNSIPHYGISRWTRNVQALRSLTGENVHYWLLAHFHADSSMPAPGGKTYINGSLIGGTEFSINELGACDPPCQKMFFVSDPIGVNSEWTLYGEVAGEKPGASYPVCPWERNG